ncbi:MAG: radical SAM protein [Clostridia bacterium]|nr:radical SAM protein [Clostridia bacterium]
MHYTLHLTNRCNLACRYCYVKKGQSDMTAEMARRVVDMAAETGGHHGIVFFGGEPLLCWEQIEETVAYAEEIQRTGKCYFHFKITTNGLLLDESFLSYACRHDIFIALSHDGLGNDTERINPDGTGNRDKLEEIAKRLLSCKPYAPVMMTVTPGTLPRYADSVRYLYGLGFRYIICTMDYSAAWRESDLVILKRQYRKLATFYREMTLREEKFYLSPFEVKISTHIRSHNLRAERCELGKKQISVAPDGKIYPCVQLVGDPMFCIGDIWLGIDEEAREALYLLNEREKEGCERCAIRSRCNHYCACLNKSATGDITKVSPFLCAHERILVPIADGVAERLYRGRNALFIQKQYNDMFPLISLAEDKTVR